MKCQNSEPSTKLEFTPELKPQNSFLRQAWAPVFLIALLAQCAFWSYDFVRGQMMGWDVSLPGTFCDFRLRYNEVEVSHRGVNPYKIWNGDTTLAGYRPWLRPGIDTVDDNHTGESYFSEDDGTRPVIGYAPWHTTFFWWYGWVPRIVAQYLIFVLYELIAVALVLYLLRWQPGEPLGKLLYWLCLASNVAGPYVHCCMSLNYGVLLIPAFIVLYESFKRGRGILPQLVGGLAFALIMVKPQIGVLVALPLLCGRRFLTVGFAALLCVLGTLWPAYVYGESPLELILQIPKYGLPFVSHFVDWWQSFGNVVQALLGMRAFTVWSALCYLACAVLSFLFRQSPSIMVRFLPAIAAVSVWNYGNKADNAFLWPLLFALVLMLLGRGPALFTKREALAVALCYLAAVLPDAIGGTLNLFGELRYLGPRFFELFAWGQRIWVMAFELAIAAIFVRRLWLSRHGEPPPGWVEKPW